MDIVQRLEPQVMTSSKDCADVPSDHRGDSSSASRRAGGWKNATQPLIVAAIIIGGFARFENLALASLWHDESWSWAMIQHPWGDIVRRMTADVHPPFYFLVLKSWVSVFGDSVVVMRALSALLGTVALLVIGPFVIALSGRLSRERQGSEHRAYGLALLAMSVLAFNPYVLSRAREVRMYPLGSLLAILSSWALLVAVRGPRRPIATWGAYVVAAVALLYTHNYGLFTVAAQGLFLVWVILSRTLNARCPLSARGLLLSGSLAFLFIAVSYAPWVPVLLKQRERVADSYYTRTLDAEVVAGVLEQFFLDKQEQRHAIAGWTSIGIVGSVLIALLIRPRTEDVYLFLLAGLPPLAAVILSLVQHRDILVGRCLYFSFPFFVVAMARLVARVPEPVVATAVGMLLVGGSAAPWLLSHFASDSPVAPGMQAAAAAVRTNSKAGDQIITVDSDGFLGMSYYCGDHPVLYLTRSGPQLDHFRGAAVIPRRAIVHPEWLSEHGAGRLWLVSSTIRPDGRTWIPEDWSPLWSTRYADSVPHRSEVYLELFGRKASPGSSSGGAR